MASISFQTWDTVRRISLDELEAAHSSVGGSARGRRYATEQINHAYAVLLSSQFQGFCRDLHLECAEHFVQSVSTGTLQSAFLRLLIENRKLDKGNANPTNLGSDYNRFGLSFWDEVRAYDLRNQGRQDRLEELNIWRNAIAHQDFDPKKVGPKKLRLQRVRELRSACDQLSESFDEVMRCHLLQINGISPW